MPSTDSVYQNFLSHGATSKSQRTFGGPFWYWNIWFCSFLVEKYPPYSGIEILATNLRRYSFLVLKYPISCWETGNPSPKSGHTKEIVAPDEGASFTMVAQREVVATYPAIRFYYVLSFLLYFTSYEYSYVWFILVNFYSCMVMTQNPGTLPKLE